MNWCVCSLSVYARMYCRCCPKNRGEDRPSSDEGLLRLKLRACGVLHEPRPASRTRRNLLRHPRILPQQSRRHPPRGYRNAAVHRRRVILEPQLSAPAPQKTRRRARDGPLDCVQRRPLAARRRVDAFPGRAAQAAVARRGPPEVLGVQQHPLHVRALDTARERVPWQLRRRHVGGQSPRPQRRQCRRPIYPPPPAGCLPPHDCASPRSCRCQRRKREVCEPESES